jgi:hypothetical protein
MIGALPFGNTVGDECVGGCVATLVVAVPRSAPEAFALPQVATSVLSDPRAPFSKSSTASLRVSEQRSLDVALAVAAEGADAVPAAAGEAPKVPVPPSCARTLQHSMLNAAVQSRWGARAAAGPVGGRLKFRD